jgi:hypothetical protein
MDGKQLFEQVKSAGIEYDHHESDLYIPVTQRTLAMLEQYEFKSGVTAFTSQIDGKVWYDVPFAYEPFWEAKQR